MISLRYAWVNLTTNTIRPYSISDDWTWQFLGGKALAARIIYQETSSGLHPFSPESVMIINTGVLNGTGAPSSSRFNITFKSVMTGGIGTSNCGGNFGMRLRQAGLDGLIISGAAQKPVFIQVLDGEISILDASHLWGLDTEESQRAFPAYYGKLVIGPAGENRVSYACVVSEERVGGRGGLGAVFGSKNLKAVVAYGTAGIPIEDENRFRMIRESWIEMLQSHPATGKTLPALGTVGLLAKASVTSILPVRNFTTGGTQQSDEITGEALADSLLVRNYGCTSCVIRCGRRVKVGGKEVKGPEYETVGLFGSNIENYDLEKICEINTLADLMGMDTISLGGTLAFAMELQAGGIVDWGLALWSTQGIEKTIEDISLRRGMGDELANGSKWLAERYGNREAAIHVKGLELAAYDPRKCLGMGLGYATANRGGCHLNGGYLAYLEGIGPLQLDPDSPRGKPELTALMQNLMDAVSSSGSCLFTTYAVFPPFLFHLAPQGTLKKIIEAVLLHSGPALQVVLKHPDWLGFNHDLLPHPSAVSAVLGKKVTIGDFIKVGMRGFTMERLFNLREGLGKKDDRLPGKLLTSQRGNSALRAEVVDDMVQKYYSIRGWGDEGIPQPHSLALLNLAI